MSTRAKSRGESSEMRGLFTYSIGLQARLGGNRLVTGSAEIMSTRTVNPGQEFAPGFVTEVSLECTPS